MASKRIKKKLSSDVNMALAVRLDNTPIDQVSCQTLLGVTLDKNLNYMYEAHIDQYVRNCQSN